MDGSIDHSDSDSGDSWTLLDRTPLYANEVPHFPDNQTQEYLNIERDEDTDGISIISESEPETPTHGELINSNITIDEISLDQHESRYLSIETTAIDDSGLGETIDDKAFLIENPGKHKTYVHRRNKRLSTVLNIIVLGSVITAAGVAIGHMWGARDECSGQSTLTVNKILSNLYKLQEENVYLRSKLQDLTHLNNMQGCNRKSGDDIISTKPNNHKNVFEEPLYNKNTNKPSKCINKDTLSIGMNINEIKHEKNFIEDLDKLKNIYNANKSWLDLEVSKRLKQEQKNLNDLKNDLKNNKSHNSSETLKIIRDFPTVIPEITSAQNVDKKKEKRISYADSLKSDKVSKPSNPKKEFNVNAKVDMKVKNMKQKQVEYFQSLPSQLSSEEELKKDDRYLGPKYNKEYKMHDSKKMHKKQKRKNKYEQWEMKRGYLKDYDDSYVTASQENDIRYADKKIQAKEFEQKNMKEDIVETIDSQSKINTNIDFENKSKGDKKKGKVTQTNWFDNRALLRNEARKRLEHELFEKTSANNAAWYFRRMQKREQCRAKGDNSTHRKMSKRNMNFKKKF